MYDPAVHADIGLSQTYVETVNSNQTNQTKIRMEGEQPLDLAYLWWKELAGYHSTPFRNFTKHRKPRARVQAKTFLQHRLEVRKFLRIAEPRDIIKSSSF